MQISLDKSLLRANRFFKFRPSSDAELFMSRTQCKWLKQKTSVIYIKLSSWKVRRRNYALFALKHHL